MKTTIYHNPRCSTSREALQILQDANEDIEVIEYLKAVPTKKELKGLLKMLGIKAEELIRKKESIYQIQFKDRSFSEDEWIDIMVENPILIQRPIVIKDKKAMIGRPVERIIDIL